MQAVDDDEDLPARFGIPEMTQLLGNLVFHAGLHALRRPWRLVLDGACCADQTFG